MKTILMKIILDKADPTGVKLPGLNRFRPLITATGQPVIKAKGGIP
jgi:hypothetical protein